MLAAAGVALFPAACQRATPPPATIDVPVAPPGAAAAMAMLYAASGASGMVATVVEGDQVTTQGFGKMGPKDPRRPDGRTLVRLQSISKLFASDLLATLVAQGRVKLSDPLTAHAPPGWHEIRPAKGPPITLETLATHTSGLPRESGIDQTLPGPIAVADRWAWLSREAALMPQPGRAARYSNLAFEFLGDALARAAGTTYGEALDRAVTGPLGMVDTTARPTADECARLMAPDQRLGPRPCIDQSGEAASGGLYSTADDMGLWMKAQLAAQPDPARRISQAVYVRRDALARASGIDHAGEASGIGLAWIEEEADGTHPRILQKTGGGDGFLTYIVIDPVRRVGIFVAFDNMHAHRLPVVAMDANALIGQLGTEPPRPLAARKS